MMFTEQAFVSIFDMPISQLPVRKANNFSTRLSDYGAATSRVKQYFEEARQQQVYNLYKEDIAQSIETDSRMEDEFFGRHHLSISDFDGTRTIVSPTPSPLKFTYFGDDEKTPTPTSSVVDSVTRRLPLCATNDGYIADDESTLKSSGFASLPRLMKTAYYQQNSRSLSSRSSCGHRNPVYVSEYSWLAGGPSTAELRQKHINAIQPRSYPCCYTPVRSPSYLFTPSCERNPEYLESDSIVSEQEQVLSSIKSNSVYESEDETNAAEYSSDDEPAVFKDRRSPESPEYSNYNNDSIRDEDIPLRSVEYSDDDRMVFRDFRSPEYSNYVTDSIHNVGFVNSSVEIHDYVFERAYAPSEYGSISGASTPELPQHDDIDDMDSVNDVQLGYDASPGTIHFFNQAGVHVTTRELQDDFVAAQATNLAGGILDMNQAAEDEKYDANTNFYEITEPLETTASSQELLASPAYGSVYIPSPKIKQEYFDPDEKHLIPTIVDDLADPDYYLGPDAPAPDCSIFDKAFYTRPAGDNVLHHDATEPRYPAIPKLGQPEDSSLIKRRTKQSVKGEGNTLQLLPATTYGQVPGPGVVSFINDISPPSSTDHDESRPIRVSKTPIYDESFLVRKRPARETFDLIELCKENYRHESARKKPCLMSTTPLMSTHPRLSTPIVCTPPLNPVLLPPTPVSAVSSFRGSPMATALQGFTGQFELHTPERLARQKKATTKHVFGNHLHANGEIINLAYTIEPYKATLDLSDCPGLSTTIEHANLHHTFAEEMPRSSEEQALRQEVHRECAAARLEGVPVGYYRYFAGHMTVEEYVEAKMCVCWEGCFCNRLCTHFGDLACPCADSLVVGEDA